MPVVTGSVTDDTGAPLIGGQVNITIHEDVNILNPPSLVAQLFTGSYTANTDSNGKWRVDTGFLPDQIYLSSFSGHGTFFMPKGSLGAYSGNIADFTCGPPGYTADTGTTVCTYNPIGQPWKNITSTLGTIGTILLTILIILGLAYLIYVIIKKYIFKEKPASIIQIVTAPFKKES